MDSAADNPIPIDVDDVRFFAEVDAETLRDALDALPGQFRRAIELAFVEGLMLPEIASRLNVPESAVRDAMRSGLIALRSSLAD